MNSIQIFNSNEFGEIRTVEKNDVIYFAGSDVAKALGYAIPHKAVQTHCKGVLKWNIPTNSGNQDVLFITEGDVYRLIMKSKLPSAEKFESWVMNEVLPSIRKNGGYIAGQETLSDDELLAKALMVAQNKIAERDTQIKSLETEVVQMDRTISELQPKANYVDMILQSKSTVTVTQIAQDYGMTARKFNQVLKELEIQRKVGNQWILYAKHQGKGYVHSSTFGITKRNGEQDVAMNTEWTQKGRLFLYEKLKEQGILPMIEKDE